MKYPKLMKVCANDDFSLSLEYDNNEKRYYNFTPNLSHPFYSQLKNIALFKNVKVENGNIEWATGQDFCPFTLYEQSIK